MNEIYSIQETNKLIFNIDKFVCVCGSDHTRERVISWEDINKMDPKKSRVKT
jgi:hypothetical protein